MCVCSTFLARQCMSLGKHALINRNFKYNHFLANLIAINLARPLTKFNFQRRLAIEDSI